MFHQTVLTYFIRTFDPSPLEMPRLVWKYRGFLPLVIIIAASVGPTALVKQRPVRQKVPGTAEDVLQMQTGV
jgi:hypothetical protein